MGRAGLGLGVCGAGDFLDVCRSASCTQVVEKLGCLRSC